MSLKPKDQILLIVTMLLFAGACNGSREASPEVVLTPPIQITDAMGYLDGGTTYAHLKDANGEELLVCVSNSSDPMIPKCTLFLGGTHPYEVSARLPLSQQEARAAIETLEMAIRSTFPSELTEKLKKGESFEEVYLDAYGSSQPKIVEKDERRNFAFHAWRLVKDQSEFDIYDPERSRKPKWYAAFEKQKQEHLVEVERQEAAEK